MGRGGKKKGDKKNEEDLPKVMASLSCEPSTSSSQTGEEKDEKDVVKPKEKTPTDDVPPEGDEEGGLGLGTSRKKRPKKKKLAAAEASAQSAKQETEVSQGQVGPTPGQARQAPIPSGPPPFQAGPPPGYVGLHPAQAGPPPGYAGPHPALAGPPPGYVGPRPAQTGPPPGSVGPRPAQAGPPPGYVGPRPAQAFPPPGYVGPHPGQAGPPPGYVGSHPGQAGPPSGYVGPHPARAGPPSGYVGPHPARAGPPPGYVGPHPAQAGPPLGHVGSSPWQADSQQSRGRPLAGPPVGPTSPPPVYSQPGYQPPGSDSPARPSSSAQTHPQPVSGAEVQHRTGQQQSVAIRPSSRFVIPDKIIGNSVPAHEVNVMTNYLPMKIKALKIHRYDVGFVPARPKKYLPRAFEQSMKKKFSNHIVAFDQMKNFYSVEALPNVTKTDRYVDNVEITDDNGRTMKFEVSFKSTGVVDLSTIVEYMKGGTSLSPPTEAIQCVDVILRQGTLQSYVKSGRTFFKRPAKPILLGDGLEMWTGLFQSAIFTSRPFINIDVAHKGFPINQPVLELLNTFRLDPRSALEQQNKFSYEMFNTFLRGLKVVALVGGATSLRREYICNGLGQPANRQTFHMTNSAGKQIEMSVADYFNKEKNCRLQYPHLNVLWVGPRDKNIYYPMELLDVAYGQVLNRQLNERQLSTMVREAASPPSDRIRKIQEVIRDMNYSKNLYFKKFGLEITENFLQVKAKVLVAPKLKYGDGVVVVPRNGQWQANKLMQGSVLKLWGFIAIDLDARASNAQSVIDLMKSCGKQMGIAVDEPCVLRYNVGVRQLETVMQEALQKNLQLLFVAMPTRGRDIYSQVKKIAERSVGMLTQCLKEQTAQRRMNLQTARNILLKVNSKLMGVNQILDVSTLPRCLREGGVMVVGADVTHPSPEQISIPSIAAVTASIDTNCFQYTIGLSIQTPKKEMIVEFEDIMVEHLRLYRERQKSLPKKIYVFRDGVSEGQFAEVMNSELQAVYNAYQKLSGDSAKRPQILFQLVQKRHHTRMFNASNISQNVEPGTVIDKEIVHARELDFYLVSHQAIKGTARPTRYHAVCNDGRIPHDEVEQLTYYLCHLYGRCFRSVSYPTPTYYAHLACLRARVLTLGEKFDNAELERRPQRLRVFDRILKQSPMFFV